MMAECDDCRKNCDGCAMDHPVTMLKSTLEKKLEEARGERKSISDIFEEVKSGVCDKICKYSNGPIPEGKDDNWLFEDGSPCETCPLNLL